MSERCGFNMASNWPGVLCTLEKGHTGQHVQVIEAMTYDPIMQQAPQPPRQVLGVATVRMRKDGLRILEAALNDTQAKGWLYGIVDADQFQPGDIVSIEVVLKERKR